MANRENVQGSDTRNVAAEVVEDFGDEWEAFDQGGMSSEERYAIFNSYFSVFPWKRLSEKAVGFDAGCGSGRWAVVVAQQVGHLHCVDPSSAIEVARRNLEHLPNCSFHKTTVEEMPFTDNSMDFGYSLGVLHHIPDTRQGLIDCVKKLKVGAPFLVYLYYAFDNRPAWFSWLWRVSDILRCLISKLPFKLKYHLSQVIALIIYFPLSRAAWLFETLGFSVRNWPLSIYRDKSFYTMRTDALDRFGTKLEQRFTRFEMRKMMETAGLIQIKFSECAPFWCAVGIKE